MTCSRKRVDLRAPRSARVAASIAPSDFSSAVIEPDLPSADTRTASRSPRFVGGRDPVEHGFGVDHALAALAALQRKMQSPCYGAVDERLARAERRTRSRDARHPAPCGADAGQDPRRACAVGESRLACRASAERARPLDASDRGERRTDFHADARPLPPRDRAVDQRRLARGGAAERRQHRRLASAAGRHARRITGLPSTFQRPPERNRGRAARLPTTTRARL